MSTPICKAAQLMHPDALQLAFALVILTTQSVFLRIAKKRLRFLHIFSYILSAPFLKVSDQGHLWSGHQVRSSDPTSKNICDCAVPTVLKASIWYPRELIMGSVPRKRTYISKFRFLRSDVTPILWSDHKKTMGKSFNAPFCESTREHANYFRIFVYFATLGDSLRFSLLVSAHPLISSSALQYKVKLTLQFLLITWYQKQLYSVKLANSHHCTPIEKSARSAFFGKKKKIMAYMMGSYVRQRYLW